MTALAVDAEASLGVGVHHHRGFTGEPVEDVLAREVATPAGEERERWLLCAVADEPPGDHVVDIAAGGDKAGGDVRLAAAGLHDPGEHRGPRLPKVREMRRVLVHLRWILDATRDGFEDDTAVALRRALAEPSDGSELVGGQGGAAPDFGFATLYRRCLWKNGSVAEIQQGGLNLGLNDRPDTLFTV